MQEMMMVMRPRQSVVSVTRDIHGFSSRRRKERPPSRTTPRDRIPGALREPRELPQQAGQVTQASAEMGMSQGVAPRNSDVYNHVVAELRTRKRPYADRTRHPAKTPQAHII
jgi:hypothetical protein